MSPVVYVLIILGGAASVLAGLDRRHSTDFRQRSIANLMVLGGAVIAGFFLAGLIAEIAVR